MRKIWLSLGVIALLGVSVLGSGCKEKVEGGAEAVKLLLARERLDETFIDGNLQDWWSDGQPSAVGVKGEKTNAVANMAMKKSVVAEALGDGFSDKGEYFQWTKFPNYSDTLGQFNSFTETVERQGTDLAKLIGKMKKDVGVTDKWVKNVVGGSQDCMLRVKSDAEYLFMRADSYYEVGKRYTRADAKNVYELYSYYNYDDGTTGDIRTQYIPGERYESMYDNDNGFMDYVIVEKSRG